MILTEIIAEDSLLPLINMSYIFTKQMRIVVGGRHIRVFRGHLQTPTLNLAELQHHCWFSMLMKIENFVNVLLEIKINRWLSSVCIIYVQV